MLTHVVHKTAALRALAIKMGVLTPNLEGILDVEGNSDLVLATTLRRVMD